LPEPASRELASATFTGQMIVACSELARGWQGAGQWVRSRSGVPLAALQRRQGGVVRRACVGVVESLSALVAEHR